MINLREFRHKPDRLSDYLMWAAMIRPGVVLNKDGSFQVTFRYRGPDLESATAEELVAITVRLNNALKRLSGGWVIYAESQRIASQEYLTSDDFPDAVTKLIEEERRQYFLKGSHFESVYYFTLVYLPPPDNVGKAKQILMEGAKEKKDNLGKEYLNYFLEEAEKLFQLFVEIFPETEPLSPEETLTYLHSAISPKRHRVIMPETPMYLDAYLYDSPLTGGFEPIIGSHHLRTISVLGFPGSTIPGIFDQLNQLNFEYRWVTRFIVLDKLEAQSEMEKYRQLWYGKRKSFKTIVKEMFTQSESARDDDPSAVLKSDDAAAAILEINSDLASYGYYTTSVVVLDQDKKEVEKKAKLIEKIINNLGFTAIIETYNCLETWFGSIPSMCRSNLRRPLLSTINLAHMLPISAIWAGTKKNYHLNGPALLYTQTKGNTPFRMDTFIGDLGHAMLIGPSGAGKSVHLALMAAQFRKYKNAQVYFFDKGGSIRVLTAGTGGNFYELASEAEGALSFQPLANIDDETERSWALEWVCDYLKAEGFKDFGPEHKDKIWEALSNLANSPKEQKTLTGLAAFVGPLDEKISEALTPLTIRGSFGRLFDAKEDNFSFGNWQAFEMERLMNTPAAVAPTLTYLFHRIEQRLTGAPTVIFLDECWVFFDNPAFAAKIGEWLRVLRKKDTSVIFATQSLQDVTKSKIAPVIMDSCPTKIFLPNPNALEERMAAMYESFGLNRQEIKIIATIAIPKKHYYYKSPLGSRMYELALGDIGLAYCAAGSIQDQNMAQQITAEYGKERFNEKWLEFKGLPQAQKFLKKE